MADLDVVSQSLLDQIALHEQRRLREIGEAWAAYWGDHPKTLKVTGKDDPDDNETLNYCRVIVDKGISFLYGHTPEITVSQGQDALDKVLRRNRWPLLSKQIALNGGVGGQCFVRLYQPQSGGDLRLLNLDPQTVFPLWEDDDYQTVLRYRVQWNAVDDDGKPIVYRTLIDRSDNGQYWTIVDQVGGKDGNKWTDRNPPANWPYPFAPIVDWQNLPIPNEYFGEPDLTSDLIDLNFSLNALASNMSKIVRLFAHPRPWVKGVARGEDVDVAPDESLLLPPNAELGALEFKADLESSIALFREKKQAFHELARVPELATGKLENIGNLSGLALQILYQPLIEKTEDKQGTYGDGQEDLARRVVVVTTGGNYEALEASTNWGNLLPDDPEAQRRTALLDQQLGVSQRTILTKLGYDPDAEAKQKAEEAPAAGEAALESFDRGPNAGAALE